MILEDISEISLHGILDRGVPNQERIALFISEEVNLGQFGIMLGIRAEGNTAHPIKDNMFWFGDGMVHPGDWIFIYTCAGEPRATDIPNTNNRLFSLHWGKPKTILSHDDIVPILFRVDAVTVLERQNVPQLQEK